MLVNPASGRGGAPRAAAVAVERLRDAGFSVRRVQGADVAEARVLAREVVEEGLPELVVVGGDGLVQVAVNELAHSRTVLGIVPAGTGNDAARSLGLPRSDPRAAADLVVAGRVRTVDLGRAGGTWFFNVVSAGFDAVVNERANGMRWPRGRARYTLATLAELRTLHPWHYELDLDGSRRAVDAVLVAVGNGPGFGGGLQVTAGAVIDDGLLDVVLFRPVTRTDLVRTYPRLYRGGHRSHPAYEHHRVSAATVGGPDLVAYADGERLGPLPVTVRAAPRALRVFAPSVPAQHPGAS